MNLIKIIVVFSILLSGCAKIPSKYKPSTDINAPRSVMPGGSNFGLTYVVRPTDTLDKIAKHNGIPYQDLAQWNNIYPPYQILIGQKLILQPPQQLPTSSNIAQSIVTPDVLGARALNPELPQNGCEVSIVRIKSFYHNNTLNSFCGLLSACVGASYIIKNNSAQARVVDVVYASDEEQRVLHRALKIEGQALFTDKVYNVDQTRDSWNIVVNDCFW